MGLTDFDLEVSKRSGVWPWFKRRRKRRRQRMRKSQPLCKVCIFSKLTEKASPLTGRGRWSCRLMERNRNRSPRLSSSSRKKNLVGDNAVRTEGLNPPVQRAAAGPCVVPEAAAPLLPP